MAGYSGTPLATKLGVVAGHTVLLDGAPDDFEIPGLPDVTLHRRAAAGPYDVVLCFCLDQARLRRRWPSLHRRTTAAGGLWIAWPKRASGIGTDLDEDVIRAHALANGRVDVKVCAIDDIWSGLKNVVRTADRDPGTGKPKRTSARTAEPRPTSAGTAEPRPTSAGTAEP